MSVFPFFPKDFRGSPGKKDPCLFGGFPCSLPKKQGKEDLGSSQFALHDLRALDFFCPKKVENRGIYRIFVSRLFQSEDGKGWGHKRGFEESLKIP